MVLDHHGVQPNPARDPRVKLPRNERPVIEPPSAEHLGALLARVAPRYRLALVVLEATGMRVGELERLAWGDVDRTQGRWRVSAGKTAAARRWVNVPPDVFAAVEELMAVEDRDPDVAVFPDASQARLRTDMARACRAAGVPTFSPHDLRHRRISIWHRHGISWAQIGQWVGQRDLSTTANIYTHVLVGEDFERAGWLATARERSR